MEFLNSQKMKELKLVKGNQQHKNLKNLPQIKKKVFIDSKDIEMGEHNINAIFNSAKELIEKKARQRNQLIHCIWYCFKSSSLRFENIEKESVTLLMN